MDFDISTLPFLAMYAEIHFKFFRFFPSYLFQKQPEILFDMPRRIEYGHDMPILLICNDIDKYPIEIQEVSISISQNNSTKMVFKKSDISPYILNHPFKKQSHSYIFYISGKLLKPGKYAINGTITYKHNNKIYSVLNDNFKGSSKAPLTGINTREKLPGQSNCIYGDLHVHSQYSRSHVEFGPPIEAIDRLSFVSGISFLGITDHSFDIACTIEDYLKPDPDLKMWNTLVNNIKSNRNNYKTTIICGEEISTCNAKKQVVHLGALGINTFIPGSKDGARKQIKPHRKEPDIPKALSLIKKDNGISFAAHPKAASGLIQKIFLKRGVWHHADIHEKLNAFQAVNCGFSSAWYKDRKMWIEILLAGRKMPVIGGNDAHGDFNRYRSIKMPFISISEDFSRHLLYARTGIYSKDTSQSAILTSIKNGETFITTGPYLGISDSKLPQKSIISHNNLTHQMGNISITGTSTNEFGKITIIKIFRGYYATRKEKMVLAKSYHIQETLSVCEKISLDFENGAGYIRASLICVKKDGTETMAVTSPCYF